MNDDQPPENLTFQLATFDCDPDFINDLPALGTPLATLATSGSRPFVVVEVVSDGHQPSPTFAVLVSIANGAAASAPSSMSCWLALSNNVSWCDVGRINGFPMVEARIKGNGAQQLIIEAARYGIADDDESDTPNGATLAFGPLFVVDFIDPAESTPGADESVDPVYEKNLIAPDAANALESILVRKHDFRPGRRGRNIAPRKISITTHPAWYPDLARLLGQETTSRAAWSGSLPNPLRGDSQRAPKDKQAGKGYRSRDSFDSGAGWTPARRHDVFGPPRFAFDDVDIVGFRIDVSGAKSASAKLDELIEPLNFHLTPKFRRFADDFRYAVATPILVIELLRYSKMRLTKDWPPVRTLDYQAQHELLLRVLVGRLDDDTAQARDAAVHVPAIFVDNPWSKALGREVQGFNKVLAEFSSHGTILSMDGRVSHDENPVSLMEVDQVTLVDRLGSDVRDQEDVLRIKYSDSVDRTDRRFDRVDLAGVAGRLTRNNSPWHQSDFDAVEFRRSFARPVVAHGLRGFRSLQISPIDKHGEIDPTWVHGTIRTKDLQYRLPTGMATLTLPKCEKAPLAWKSLRKLLGSESTTFPTGRWYRAHCSMTLSIEDGLRW